VGADPTSPFAVFDDLPTNHVLTLRLDVPDSFAVSKKVAVEVSEPFSTSIPLHYYPNTLCSLGAGH
jgi:hypothetical protein